MAAQKTGLSVQGFQFFLKLLEFLVYRQHFPVIQNDAHLMQAALQIGDPLQGKCHGDTVVKHLDGGFLRGQILGLHPGEGFAEVGLLNGL